MSRDRFVRLWGLATALAAHRGSGRRKGSRRANCIFSLQELEDRIHLSVGVTPLSLVVPLASAPGFHAPSAPETVHQGGQTSDRAAHDQGNQQTATGPFQPAQTYAPGAANSTPNDRDQSIAQAARLSGQDPGAGQQVNDPSPDNYPIPPGGAPARHEDDGGQTGSMPVLLPLKNEPAALVPAGSTVLTRIEVPAAVENKHPGPTADRPVIDSLTVFLNTATQTLIPANSITGDEPQPAAHHGPLAVTILLNLSADLGSAGNATAEAKVTTTMRNPDSGAPEAKMPGRQVSARSENYDSAVAGAGQGQERIEGTRTMVVEQVSCTLPEEATAGITAGPAAPERVPESAFWQLRRFSRSVSTVGILLASSVGSLAWHGWRFARGRSLPGLSASGERGRPSWEACPRSRETRG